MSRIKGMAAVSKADPHKAPDRKGIEQPDDGGELARDNLLEENKLDREESQVKKEGRREEDGDGIAKDHEGQAEDMARRRPHVELSVVRDRRDLPLRDVLPHQGRNGVVAGQDSGTVNEKGDADDHGQKDNGRQHPDRSVRSEPEAERLVPPGQNDSNADDGRQEQKREERSARYGSENGDIVLEPKEQE